MSSAQHPSQLQPGDLIGEYRIVRAIGVGGFSRVFLVERHGRQYVVKMATTSAQENDRDRVDGWLHREVASMERVAHDHLLPVHDVSRWPDARTGFSYFVTDYVPGATLRQVMRYSEVNPSQWVGVVCDVLRALEALHAAGVVHRDLKADNVLVREEDGQIFLIDLGSAHLPGASPLTEGVAPGTLYCQPPEVLSFAFGVAPNKPEARMEAHPAADLYGVGVLLYEALTGQSPFDPKRPLEELLPVILHKEPPDPRQLNPRLPASLAGLCMRLLAKNPHDRPQSARAVREELERLQAEEGDSEPWQTPILPRSEPEPPVQEEAPAQPAAPPEEERKKSETRGRSHRQWPRLLGVLLGLVLLLALGWMLFQGALTMPFSLDPSLSVVAAQPAHTPSASCLLLRRVLGGLSVAWLAGCATTPPPATPPDPLDFLARCSTEARITPRTLGFQPHDEFGPDDYSYPTYIESGTPASSQSIEDGGPLNIRSGPILATLRPLIDGKEDQDFLVAGEAFVTPSRVYIELDRIQLPDGSWLPFCGVAYAGDDKRSRLQFGVPTYAAEPLAVAPLDPALVDTRPGSVVLNDPRFETFVQPANPKVRPSFLRMPPAERR